MQRTSLSVLLLVALVTVAGCNAFSSGSDTPMVTPMDVPTDEPTPTLTTDGTRQQSSLCISSLPDIGFTNASALAAAQTRLLHNRSYTASYTSTSIYQNGSIASLSDMTVHVAANYSRIRFVSEGFGTRSATPPHRFVRWKNESRVVTRWSSGPTARYEARPFPPEERGHFRSFALAIASPKALVNATACVIDQFPHDDTTLFVVAFTRSEPLYTDPNTSVVRPVTGRALVSASGIVYELRWDYTLRTGDGTVLTVTSSIYYTDIGTTTAERPLWYEKAVNHQTQTNRTTDGA